MTSAPSSDTLAHLEHSHYAYKYGLARTPAMISEHLGTANVQRMLPASATYAKKEVDHASQSHVCEWSHHSLFASIAGRSFPATYLPAPMVGTVSWYHLAPASKQAVPEGLRMQP